MYGLWREKKDGRRAPGYLLYLLGGIAAVMMIWFLHRRTGGAAPAPRRQRAAVSAAEVSAITQPAALMSPVKLPEKRAELGARSYRLRENEPTAGAGTAPPESPAGDTFNAISAALAGTAGGDTPLDSIGPRTAAAPHYAGLPPAFPPEARLAPGAAEEALAPPVKLLEYRDPLADGEPPAMGNGAPLRNPGTVVPRGTLIPVYLLTTVDTSNPAAVLQFGIAEDVVWNHRRQIPFGTRILGKLAGRPMRDRLNLTADTVLYPDGLEIPVNASAVEADETGGDIRPGIAAAYCPPPRWVQVAPYVSDAVTGFLSLLQSRAQQQLSVGVGAVTVQTSTPDEVRAPLYQAGIQGIQDFTAARLKEVEQRYASYYLIPAGTACWLQLEADLDLSAVRSTAPDPVRRGLPLSGTPSRRASETDPIP
jgi:hypothetical protein